MKFKFIQLFLIFNLIQILLLEGQEYDFGKYGTYKTLEYCSIFNPTEFEIGETMFFKITAKEFNDDYLYYEYLDDLENYEFNFEIKKLHEVKYYYNYEPDEDSNNKPIHYFKIIKKKEDLGDLQGKYLLLYCNFEGTAEIENTEKDEGKTVQIYTIVFSIIGVLIIAIICYFCYFRKKCKKDKDINDNNEINVVQYNPQNNEQKKENIENSNLNMNFKNKDNNNKSNKYMKPQKNTYNNENNDNNNNYPPIAENNNNYNRTKNIPDVQFTGNGNINGNPNNNVNNIPDAQYTGKGNIYGNPNNNVNNILDSQYIGNGNIYGNLNNNLNNIPDTQYKGNGGFVQSPNSNQYYNIPQNSADNRP